MKKSWEISITVSFIIISIIFYFLFFNFTHDPKQLIISFISSLAFLPLSVIVYTVIMNELLKLRDKQKYNQKINLLIGTFFIEVGTNMLESLIKFDLNFKTICNDMHVNQNWTNNDFINLRNKLFKYKFNIDSRRCNLNELKELLYPKREFLLSIIENQNILENEKITNLIFSIFHINEELSVRLKNTLKDSDYDHLSTDLGRAYSLLIKEWVEYMMHLKKYYPYLFSYELNNNKILSI